MTSRNSAANDDGKKTGKAKASVRLVGLARSLRETIARFVPYAFGKPRENGLGLKSDIRIAPVTPKAIQARVLNPDVAHGAPLEPKAVVRVVTGSPKDHWIKKL